METRVAIKDASVLIDLANGELIGHWFSLEVETIITDSVYREIKAGRQFETISPFVDAGLIAIDVVPDSEAAIWLATSQQFSDELRISFPDATALICALKRNALLLTGDGALRSGAQSKGVEVRGVLWVLDMLLWADSISFIEAIDSLQKILDEGARLPIIECERRTENWNRSEKIEPRGLPSDG